jgi:hypothetical protein
MDMQTRHVTGPQVRRRLHAEVVSALRDDSLSGPDRAFVLEHVQTAHARDGRDDLGGARHLHRAARSLDTPTRLLGVLDRLATAYIHPGR